MRSDDYITKPFSMLILGKRITALLRRSENKSTVSTIRLGNVTVDFAGYTAHDENGKIDITPKELEILKVLIENKGLVLSRNQILDDVWGYDCDVIDRTIDAYIFKSITFDNGTEFAAAEELERSCINKHLPRTKVYFCHPYSSWERGTNENTNGMIRRRFPKGTNFAAVTNAQIAQAENWINNYPRKILGYRSSEIVFRECLRELGIAA